MLNQPPTANEVLEESGHLLVRRAIERDDIIADALFELLAGTQREWTLPEWEKVLHTASQDQRHIRELVAA